ncbi:hypothetical protein ACVWXO_010225 [Bradyrhizobium sp. LM2.7]
MTDEAMSPLRRRMIEDMTIRKLAPKTQHDYVQRVKNFAAFLGRSPDMASFEDVRRYQLHLAASGVGVPTINQTVSTLRFFFRVTLRRYDIVEHAHFIHEPRKLPVGLFLSRSSFVFRQFLCSISKPVSVLSFWNMRNRHANWIMPRRTRALPERVSPFSRRFLPLSSGEPVRPA